MQSRFLIIFDEHIPFISLDEMLKVEYKSGLIGNCGSRCIFFSHLALKNITNSIYWPALCLWLLPHRDVQLQEGRRPVSVPGQGERVSSGQCVGWAAQPGLRIRSEVSAPRRVPSGPVPLTCRDVVLGATAKRGGVSKTSLQGSLSMDTRGPADPRAEAVSRSDPGHQGAVASNLRARALASPSQPNPSPGLLLAQGCSSSIHLGRVAGDQTPQSLLVRSYPGPAQFLPKQKGSRAQLVGDCSGTQPGTLTPTGAQ